ncbi:hypothetical protein SLEP1_g11440 [Rubroshorea leprosula]|uniref:DUF4219 domain-containing protein n=1 Tax=Rubroshorea leprosula TaxID=152421 RepID=A0AAV5IH42_9ROSI|nr:hypothetical protein SLEP1_g11440 [Rubroshorea leprosula]
MAQFQDSQPLEGLFTTKPPFFNGTNYNYWKNRMKVYMLANEPRAWIVTRKGPYVPMKVVRENEVPKKEIEWNDEDLGKIMINNKAINMLQCALNARNSIEFPGVIRLRRCGTSQKLNDVVTNLKALVKVYHSQEVVRKVLKTLPKNWEAKKTTIEESKNLNTLKLDDLIGKLMTYEMDIQVYGGI